MQDTFEEIIPAIVAGIFSAIVTKITSQTKRKDSRDRLQAAQLAYLLKVQEDLHDTQQELNADRDGLLRELIKREYSKETREIYARLESLELSIKNQGEKIEQLIAAYSPK